MYTANKIEKWVVYALISSCLVVLRDIGCKNIIQNYSPIEAIFSFYLFSPLLLLPLILVWNKTNNYRIKIFPNKHSYRGLLATGVLNTLAFFLYLGAFKEQDFSIIAPLRNLTPIFALPIGILVFREKPGWNTVTAVFLVCLSIILLHNGGNTDMLAKLSSWPSLAALLSALVFAGTILTNKLALDERFGKMDTTIYLIGLYAIMAIIYGIMVVFLGSTQQLLELYRDHWLQLVIINLLTAAFGWYNLAAIKIAPMTKVAPVLRLQVLIGIILGGAFFREEDLILRIIAGAIMTIGLILVARPGKN